MRILIAVALTAALAVESALLPPASHSEPGGRLAKVGVVAPSAAEVQVCIAEGRYSDAEGAARQMLEHLATQGEEDSLAEAVALHLLATALSRGGKAAQPETKALALQDLELRERWLGPDHPEVADSLCLLGGVLSDLSDNGAAHALYGRALAIREKSFGPDDPSVARVLNLQGACLREMGDYEGSRRQLERALAISEKALDPDHADIAKCLDDRGSGLRRMGELREARALYERVLAIDERS